MAKNKNSQDRLAELERENALLKASLVHCQELLATYGDKPAEPVKTDTNTPASDAGLREPPA